MPITFCDFVGKEETKPGGSKVNTTEAAKVVCYDLFIIFERMILLSIKVQIARVIHKVHKVDLRQIALMTPYRAQKECLKELAKQSMLLGTNGLAVATITESQGIYTTNKCNLGYSTKYTLY